MRARFYWQACFNFHTVLADAVRVVHNEPRSAFWVSATPEEAEKHIVPRMGEDMVSHYRSLLEDKVLIEDSYMFGTELYFQVPASAHPRKGDVPWIMPRIHPYSSFWGRFSPWIPIGKRMWDQDPVGIGEPMGMHLDAIEELEKIEERLQNHGYLALEGWC